ncbi:MAG: 5,10-methenyltetrahydrofolate synthetase [Cenarchaeum sp. SB0661_bin_35]|nr:5,10-methenyltetrahydrofolate synthetase [Cenarchaeum sp. SB0667_bin_13]MXY37484.1 5,10-methenyltetrahydrofolate synthetase [Cenarchaeum sp. SB0664_bin_35]MXZ93946.1 5,10-methenyltetrahydrofolate synthetase [Cenarchaeum sp. SB0666_bin_15]MYB47348.1 5,10-methenyltetrahydrofolate synthetase [Cenarchaeum sp. SB0662_bin_33]MYC80104.1 5,10-methenyltetrahydrofolate synthetase [Cenarchaeum sp. SB0661_bin_35]MYD59185.1 5,10-methenyltetrahydrofolate synthetase [Cenarchaeum sp. SB0678_bin_8]MYI51910
MTLRYEANPPKTSQNNTDADSVVQFLERLRRTAEVCGGVHITENVLGHSRVSPILVGRHLYKSIPGVKMTLTMRVRDKSTSEIDTFVQNSMDEGFSGILVVAGDGTPDSPGLLQIPSSIAYRLRRSNMCKSLKVYLSVPTDPVYAHMKTKIDARPHGFMTQVVQNYSQVQDIVANLPDFDIIPIVLYPSPKNHKAASFLQIDMSQYADEFPSFVNRIHDLTGDVLLTSPGDHASLYKFLVTHQY